MDSSTMSVSKLYLTEFPVEILEKVFMCLPGQDIIRMEVICRRFLDVVRGSPTLQYQCELLAAGLADNPNDPCDLDERRRLCWEYVQKWSDATNMTRCFREVPLEHESSSWWMTIPGRNLLAPRRHESNNMYFTHVPPAMSRKPIERWCLPPFQFDFLRNATYPPKNVLAVVEQREESIRIHLLNLLDGSPYRISPPNVIVWELPEGFESVYLGSMAMTASRLMMYIGVRASTPIWRMVVWDWETGELVLNRSGVGNNSIRDGSQVAFLDEFRIMVTYRDNPLVAPELLVFNTFVPQDHPGNMRRFRLPPKYRDWSTRVHLDHDRSLGAVNRDGPLITDPTQAIFVMDLSPNPPEPAVLLVLRMQPLIKLTCSTRTDVQIPWDEWGRGSVVLEIPRTQTHHIYLATVHGARLLAVYGAARGDVHRSLHLFDFSWKGCAVLPPSDRNDDGPERKAPFEHGRSCAFNRGDWVSPWGLQSLGDSIVAVGTNLGSTSDDSNGILRILDLM